MWARADLDGGLGASIAMAEKKRSELLLLLLLAVVWLSVAHSRRISVSQKLI